jgi:phosphoglycerate dehydrogenase-like enzyme
VLTADGVFIINSSRGPVINEEALIDALKSNKVKRAALDVFEKEPSIPEYFLNNPKVTVMPREYPEGVRV